MIAPFQDTIEFLIIRYSMALSIVAMFAFILFRIFRK
jgi:hypothetical protein